MREKKRKIRKRRTKTFIEGMEGLPKRCKHPLEELRNKPRTLFAIVRGGAKGGDGMAFSQQTGGALARAKSKRFTFWFLREKNGEAVQKRGAVPHHGNLHMGKTLQTVQ